MTRQDRFITTLLLLTPLSAHAIDHKNLDEERPLKIEDPYPIAEGEIASEVGAGFNLGRESPNRALIPLQVLYGAFPNFHVSIGTTFVSSPLTAEGVTRSGDINLAGLYNFNQETLSVPALGLKLTLNLPTGLNSSGTDVEIKGIVSKSVERLSLFLNVSHVFVSGSGSPDGNDLHRFLFGGSYPIGAPRYTRTIFLADVFTEMSNEPNRNHSTGVELGLRHQLTRRVALDSGLGSEFSGPEDRSAFYFRAGASFAI